MDQLENSLSVEQKFSHKVFSEQVKQLSSQQAQELLIQMHKQMLFKDNLYKELFLSQEKDIVNALFRGRKN